MYNKKIGLKFRGFLPVVVDVETGGYNPNRDALLEIAAIIIGMDARGHLEPVTDLFCNVEPFPGSNLNPDALKCNRIIPDHPFRDAKPEHEALDIIFKPIRQALKPSGCRKAILVGHNAFFDLDFIKASVMRTDNKNNPFHRFSTLDTVTLGAMAYGHTVLPEACKRAGLGWNDHEAHSAIYDAAQTAKLFCLIMNRWHDATVS